MITAVALSPSLDVAYGVQRAVGIQRPTHVRRVAGGKALNAARAAIRLGADVYAIAILGGPVGDLVAALAREDGLTLEAIAGDALTRTCITVHAAEGEGIEVYEPAVRVAGDALDALRSSLVRVLAVRPGWCFVSGGMPPGLGADTLTDLVAVARGAGTRVAVDTHGEALRGLVGLPPGRRPDLIKVNRAEAAWALGAGPDVDPAALAAALHAGTGATTVVTDGVAGAAGHDGAGPHRVGLDPATMPVGRHPVGSGDSFLAGLVVGLDRGEDVAAALRTATGAAVANAQQPGAGVLDPELAARLSDAGGFLG